MVDGAARVIRDAVEGYIYASGATEAVTDAAPDVVPLDDSFTEQGLPAVLVAMGPWIPAIQPGNERLTLDLVCSVWRPRVPLGEVVAQLYADRDAISDAWIAHAKAYLTENTLQSAVLQGGPGIVPRETDKGSTRFFLTLPFRIQIKANRAVDVEAA